MRYINGHKKKTLSESLTEIANWCEENNISHDTYGKGEDLNRFEEKMAETMGFESALFVPSGTMAQLIALRVHCDESGKSAFGCHSTSHLLNHEFNAHNFLHNMNAHILGQPHKIMLASDIEENPLPLSAVIMELPTRDLGCQLPTWEELQDIKQVCKFQGIPLHVDGARIWECQPYYDKSFREICRGFTSLYVSFYKGVGALSGAMLFGNRSFIAQARVWLRRHGGNIFTQAPVWASAVVGLEKNIGRFKEFHEKAQELVSVLQVFPKAQLLPKEPKIQKFKVFLDYPQDLVLRVAKRVEDEIQVSLVGPILPSLCPSKTHLEYTIGENTLSFGRDDLKKAFKLFFKYLEEAS